MEISQWDCLEIAVQNPNSYENPFEDVTLDVVFSAPNGRLIIFYGFYDIDGWKIRVMPDQLGIWSYEATFSDGTSGISGEFECISSTIPGLISRDEYNPIWFGYRGSRRRRGQRFVSGRDPVGPRHRYPLFGVLSC